MCRHVLRIALCSVPRYSTCMISLSRTEFGLEEVFFFFSLSQTHSTDIVDKFEEHFLQTKTKTKYFEFENQSCFVFKVQISLLLHLARRNNNTTCQIYLASQLQTYHLYYHHIPYIYHRYIYKSRSIAVKHLPS